MQMLSNWELNCKRPGSEMKLINLRLMAQFHVSIGVTMVPNQNIVDHVQLSHQAHRHQQPQLMHPLMDQPTDQPMGPQLKNLVQITQPKNQQQPQQ